MDDQETAVAKVLKSRDNVFISGAAGTGKSFLVGMLVKELSQAHYTFALTAMTGAAASLLNDAQTLHSALGVGRLGDSVDTLVRRLRSKRAPAQVRHTWARDILIIDEISMLSGEDFGKLEAVARGVRRCEDPFGGMRLVLVGDLLQLPPVGKGSTPPDFVFLSESWSSCRISVVQLRTNRRQTAGSTVEKCLSKIRIGTIDDEVRAFLESRMQDPPEGVVVTELHGDNASVDSINALHLERLKSKGSRVERYDLEVILKDPLHQESLDRELRQTILPSHLVLAVGAEVMLTKNLDTRRHLVNGTRGSVVGFDACSRLPIVKFVGGGGTAMVRMADHLFQDEAGRLLFTLKQVPLRLAYALTVHKAQGVTLSSAIVNMRCIFQPGQAYVALSRIRTADGLYIRNLNIGGIRASKEAMVYLARESGEVSK
jgi:ATP-dependent DNA helicase PIF1